MNKSAFNLNAQNNDISLRIVAALERISQSFRVLLWNVGKDFSLSPIQLQILIFLHYHSEEKRKVSYLASEFNMTKATISDSVKILEQKGFINKIDDPVDTRSFTMMLTESGLSVVNKVEMFSSSLQQPIDLMDIEEKESLLLSLISIIQHLHKTGIISIQRMCFTCVHYDRKNNGSHFCKLLNMPLNLTSLRIDCPEHQPS